MSGVKPARIGLLWDYITEGQPTGAESHPDVMQSLQLVVDEYLEKGIIDRPVEFVLRHVQGLPKGSFKAVRDAFYELVEEDCLVIYGPWVSENGAPLRDYVEDLAEVPIITMAGTETMLGDYVFAVPAMVMIGTSASSST